MKPGDAVLVREVTGNLIGIGKCVRVTNTQFVVCSTRGCFPRGHYSLKSGAGIGAARGYARLPKTIDEFNAAQEELARRDAEKEAAEAAERQAEYDALPESVKLARALRWLCDCEKESTIAEAPIEHLRGIIAWAKSRKLTTE